VCACIQKMFIYAHTHITQMLASQRSMHLKEVVALKERLVQLQLKAENRDSDGLSAPGAGGAKAAADDKRQVSSMYAYIYVDS
jgi:hypothetical protein